MVGTPHIVVTVHGIRTFGQWQQRLQGLLQERDPSITFYNYRFGYFSILAFLTPLARWLVVRRFRREILKIWTERKPERIDFVGHSFGTHLIAWGLRRLLREHDIPVHTVILSGSVLRSSFFWPELVPQKIKRVINDCGSGDAILLLSQFFVLFTGMAGRVGFVGMEGPEFTNRYSVFGHSGYFRGADGKEFSDRYMAERWVPLISGTEPVQVFDERQTLSALGGFGIWLTNNLEPIKLIGYASPFIALALYLGALLAVSSLSNSRVTALVALYDTSEQRGESLQPEELLVTFRRALGLPLKRAYVLWVDDEPDNNTLERAALRKFGLCFDKAASTDEAVGLLERTPGRYAMVISDFDRPNDPSAGYKLLEKVGQLSPQTPLIFYVSRFTPEQAEDARRRGAIDEVTGPYSLINRVLSNLSVSNTPVTRFQRISQELWGCARE